MQANDLTDDLCVQGQIQPEDIEKLKNAGIKTIICNRPDGEKPDQAPAEEICKVANAAGLDFHHNPIVPGGVTPQAVKKQKELLENADGKVLAYCGSGKRATVLWMLANPEGLSADERIERAAKAGYDLAMLRPNL